MTEITCFHIKIWYTIVSRKLEDYIIIPKSTLLDIEMSTHTLSIKTLLSPNYFQSDEVSKSTYSFCVYDGWSTRSRYKDPNKLIGFNYLIYPYILVMYVRLKTNSRNHFHSPECLKSYF
ncbi:hypothetical protein RF11_03502 [Thelohanellus kitauei]|uniref:Uncharacterized protein n=1 Tax=Thelohanellus kitauei TaxID=669202 RepID=A0A0C2NB14_THEKT|nr:hypothetical protein RF11_03502 [Thelohanellus kitauei]